RESISGVSIDEEMINMIKFQQAFNAAARLIGVAEEMMDNLINRV
ncbi:MAG: flagellar basal body rod C-terminal domain-containing protein, partial [Nitrospinaceae bacterium]